MEAPKNKAEFYHRYYAGEFGNKLLAWPSGKDMWESGYRGRVTMRAREAGSSLSIAMYGVPAETAKDFDYNCNETPPDDKLVIQGEVYVDHSSSELLLTYSFVRNIPNQSAVRFPYASHATGAIACSILNAFVPFEDLAHIWDLLRKYEGVVEFSTYRVRLGNLNRHTVIWEVRNY